MKVFPKDVKRRELWAAAIHRPDIKLTSHSALCEIHFDKDSWEKVRQDGSRKLRISAVPTLSIPMVANKQCELSILVIESPTPIVYSHNETGDEVKQYRVNNAEDISNETKQKIFTSEVRILSCKLDRCIKLLEKSNRQKRVIEKKLRALRIENKRLRASICNDSGKGTYLNNNQREMIEKRYKKCKKWSLGTLKGALKLKLACGNNGYKEILKQNIPPLSLRTLARKQQEIEFDDGTKGDSLDLLEMKVARVENDMK